MVNACQVIANQNYQFLGKHENENTNTTHPDNKINEQRAFKSSQK